MHVADRLDLISAETLGVPVQVITVPWVSRSALMTKEELAGQGIADILAVLEERVGQAVQQLINAADPGLPLILTAHASVQGATYGSERAVMLGHELVLGGNLILDRRLDYVAMGHIHKHQSLNDGGRPPVVYPGSIERIDFGELGETKGFVLAKVSRGSAQWEFVPLETRRFLDFKPRTHSADHFMDDILQQLPESDEVRDCVCRVQLTYPRDWESLLDEAAIGERFRDALMFQIVKHRESGDRSRLGDLVAVESLRPEELLDHYWRTVSLDEEETAAMQALAREIFTDLAERT
jgi:exonuclease SbcD